jgi:ADP-ribose pyrophosphatase YjhB (NUDIX family)
VTSRPPAHLTDDEFSWASRHLPIACVDILPVVRDASGRVASVGLIRRDSPFGPVWCQVGGRLLYGETLDEGAQRHISETLGDVAATVGDEPFFVNEYFPQPRPPHGVDPRKHAVAVCFTADLGEPRITTGGEATDFAWFNVDALPDDLWPGTRRMLDVMVGESGWRDEGASYDALVAREVSHNGLMWQTPTLTMTAMAFLMTIALGDGSQWGRALAALLSATVALVSIQLMLKHSYNQLTDANALWTIERSRGMRQVHAPTPPSRERGAIGWLQRRRSRTWWVAALGLFGLASIVVLVLAILGV